MNTRTTGPSVRSSANTLRSARSLRAGFSLALVLASAACSRTTTGSDDGGLVCDADVCVIVAPDGAVVTPEVGPGVETGVADEGADAEPVDAYVPRCGNRILDQGESCDDGNNVDNDGCSAMCRFEARCGDNHVDPGEVCDDGNLRSGDGCRSDCRSNETCGNGIVDTVRGEVCDPPGATCSMDCRSIPLCGNGRMDPGETCDDGNSTRWDGCAPDCRVEQGIVFDSFFIGNERAGCDFTGDGRPDNTFSVALGPGTGILNTAINNGVSNGTTLIQLGFLGLDDQTGVVDPDLRVGWFTGLDGDMDTENNRDPGTLLRVNSRAINPMTMLPLANYQSAIAMTQLSGGPEDIALDLPGPMGMAFSFNVRRSRIQGALMTDGTRITGLDEGLLCGAIPTADIARLRNFFAFTIPGLGGGGSGGSGGTDRSTLLEALVGGYRITIPIFGSLNVGPAQPDVDLDGDGLERFEATRGDTRNPPQITACIDGNGTRIPGRECQMDPRMADGFTVGFRMNGVWFRFNGVGTGTTGMGMGGSGGG